MKRLAIELRQNNARKAAAHIHFHILDASARMETGQLLLKHAAGDVRLRVRAVEIGRHAFTDRAESAHGVLARRCKCRLAADALLGHLVGYVSLVAEKRYEMQISQHGPILLPWRHSEGLAMWPYDHFALCKYLASEIQIVRGAVRIIIILPPMPPPAFVTIAALWPAAVICLRLALTTVRPTRDLCVQHDFFDDTELLSNLAQTFVSSG